uniref:ATP binding protein, putative n=1 Tax=Arundo donax TaxID=35708 RepID=A0A0A9G4U3_ARUDO
MKTGEVLQLFFMKMHQRDCSNSSLLLFVVAIRCSKHVLQLVCCCAQRDLN